MLYTRVPPIHFWQVPTAPLMADERAHVDAPDGLPAFLQRIARSSPDEFDAHNTLVELLNHAAMACAARSAYLKRTGADPGRAIIACSEVGDVMADGTVISTNVSVVDEGVQIATLVLLRESNSMPLSADQLAQVEVIADLIGLAMRRSAYDQEIRRNQQAVREAIEAKYQLLGGVSLNLKNSLSVAGGYLQLIDMEEQRSGELHDFVVKGRRAIDAAVGLINELVSLARAEAGDVSIELDTISLSTYIRAAINAHSPTIARKRILVNTEDASRLPTAYTDPNQVREILDALLSNAVKYTPEGGVITIRTDIREGRRRGDPASWACVTVQDSGPGIEGAEHIFDEVRRLDMPKNQVGFRLVICRRIARLLGGDLTLESVKNRGAAFTLWLPLSRTRP